MVFVSMTAEDLLSQTTQYQIHYTLSPLRIASDPSTLVGREEPRSVSGRASLYPRAHPSHTHDPFALPPLPRRDYHASWISPHDPMGILPINGDGDVVDEAEVDAQIDSYLNGEPPPVATNLPSPPPFTVITDCDDKSGDEEEESSAAILADRYRRDRIAASYSSDEEDDDPGISRLINRHHRIMGPPAGGIRRSRRRVTPSRIEPSSTPSHASHSQNENAAPTSEALAPHARFFIEREKSMVSMKFDPPV